MGLRYAPRRPSRGNLRLLAARLALVTERVNKVNSLLRGSDHPRRRGQYRRAAEKRSCRKPRANIYARVYQGACS
jgi:hypothetical protein